MKGRGYVVHTVVLVSVVVGAAAALLLRIGPRRLGGPVARRARPATVLPGSQQPVRPEPAPQHLRPEPALRTAPTAPNALAARSASEAVGASVAAGAPTAPVPPAGRRRGPKNSGARHFRDDARAAERVHARR